METNTAAAEITILRGTNIVRALIPGWELAIFHGGAIEIYKVDNGLPSYAGLWCEIGCWMPDHLKPVAKALADLA